MKYIYMYSFDKIKKYLHFKQREVEEKLRSIDQAASVSSQIVPESSELGTASWQADTDATKQAIRLELLIFYKKIQNTLIKINKGSFGKCERCGREIQEGRLEIMPTAELCINCKNNSNINFSRKFSVSL